MWRDWGPLFSAIQVGKASGLSEVEGKVVGEVFPFARVHGEVGNLVRECVAGFHPGVNTPLHKLEEPVGLFLLGSRADGDKGFRGVAKGEGVD